MGIISSVREFFDPPLHERSSEFPDLQSQLDVIWNRNQATWRAASIKEALGVPAIFRCVSLIANTVGSLSMEGFRNGALMTDPPRIIQRPNPLTTGHDFYRDSAFHLATRGEFWWWVAMRDADNIPLSLYPVPPWEVRVEKNERDRLRPRIVWQDTVMANEDMVHVTFLPSEDGLRGIGPLQSCMSAVSVTVEAQEFAANYFAGGGIPPLWIKSAVKMNDDELDKFTQRWLGKPPGFPRITTPTIEDVKVLEGNPENAQLAEARNHQVGEAVRMFGVPGALVEFAQSGQSLTYQNVSQVWTQFLRGCLAPNFLEKIEQAMSDLLTRSTIGRFNIGQLDRADVLTRAEVYEKLVPIGVMSTEQAQQAEGFAPGNVDFAPVPMAAPAAIPSLLPINIRSYIEPVEIRCQGTNRFSNGREATCNRVLGKLAAPYEIRCPRCKTVAVA